MEQRDTYARLVEADLDTIELPPTIITDACEYVTSSLRKIILNVKPVPWRRTFIFRIIRSAYHDGEDSTKKYYCIETSHALSNSSISPFIIEIEVPPKFYGCTYIFHIIREENQSKEIVEHLKFTVKSQRTRRELRQHLVNIQNAVYKGRGSMIYAILYRNVSDEDLQAGIIQPKMRRRSGHPHNIAFGLFPVLHFCVRLVNGALPSFSPYSPNQLSFAPNRFFDWDTRLFLVDIHCYYTKIDSPHYIILVLASEGLQPCWKLRSLGALELNIADNPFMTYNSETKQLKTADRLRYRRDQGPERHNKVWTEIMVADEQIPILVSEARFQRVSHQQKDRFPRVNTDCELCNAIGELDQSIFIESDIMCRTLMQYFTAPNLSASTSSCLHNVSGREWSCALKWKTKLRTCTALNLS